MSWKAGPRLSLGILPPLPTWPRAGHTRWPVSTSSAPLTKVSMTTSLPERAEDAKQSLGQRQGLEVEWVKHTDLASGSDFLGVLGQTTLPF